MRILYFYQYFTTPSGSYSTRVYEFTRRWVKAGASVTVVTSVYDKSGIDPKGIVYCFSIEGVDVRMINIGLSNKHAFVQRILTFVAYDVIASLYALFSPADVVVCSSGPLTVGIPGLIARYLRGIPLVFEVRDLWPEGAIQLGFLRNDWAIRLSRTLERLCYRAASYVIPLSDGMAEWIQRSYGKIRMKVIPNASDNDLVAALPNDLDIPKWALGKCLIVYAGSIGLIDDCAQILFAAEVIQKHGHSDIVFVVIGEGKERRQLLKLSEELNLNNIRFLGSLPKPQVFKWLRLSCCALLTVKDVPFLATCSPNKLFDAFAAGVPIIQATNGWIHDLIRDENCGMNIASNSGVAWATAIEQLSSDNSLRETLAQNANRIAHESFDRDLLAREMMAVLTSVVREDKS